MQPPSTVTTGREKTCDLYACVHWVAQVVSVHSSARQQRLLAHFWMAQEASIAQEQGKALQVVLHLTGDGVATAFAAAAWSMDEAGEPRCSGGWGPREAALSV